MFLAKIKCRQVLLLLIGLSSATVVSANQSLIVTNSENSPSFISSFPHFSSFYSPTRQGHVVVQLGGYWGLQGETQHINIKGLIGDTFTVTDRHSHNGLMGLGYLIDGQDRKCFKMSYGIYGFYLPKTSVSGKVIQEDLFTNLSYGYRLTHYPVYAVAKFTLTMDSAHYALTVDAGVGPNFMRAHDFQEQSLDGGSTIPGNVFSAHTSTTLSATAGIGIKLNNVFAKVPVECGYRFFYLGKGRLNTKDCQLLNTLNTGNTYANAIVCSLTI